MALLNDIQARHSNISLTRYAHFADDVEAFFGLSLVGRFFQSQLADFQPKKLTF